MADQEPTKYFDRHAEFFQRKFEAALPYDDYVATGSEKHQQRWNDQFATISLAAVQHELLGSFVRRMNVLVVSGTWCGDCVRQVPILRRFEMASSVIAVRILDRDAHPDLRDELRIAGAAKVPVALFLDEDFFQCARYGDRPLATYRKMARVTLGPACPIGPSLDPDELQGSIRAWLEEFERIQLLLRLSMRLRNRYSD